MEKLPTILLAAGVGCFGLAGVLSGYLPLAHLAKIEVNARKYPVDRARGTSRKYDEL